MKERYNQLPVWPCWRVKGSGETYPTIHKAALAVKDLSFNLDHVLIRSARPEKMKVYHKYAALLDRDEFTRTTMFNEIEVVTREPSPEIRALYRQTPGTKEIETTYMAEQCVKALAAAIEDEWEPDKVHIMPHSAGYDSRLISAILRNLARKNGPEWLGEMRFACWEPETAYFKRIMDHMGWPERFICPIRSDRVVDYYERVTDFDLVGEIYCEPERFWAGPALARVMMQDEGIDEDDCVGITALFGDETGKMNRLSWPGISYFLACYLFENPSPWLGSEIPFMTPFVSKPWLELLSRYKIPCTLDYFKLEMIAIADREMVDLFRFPNFRFVHGPIMSHKKYHPHQVLSEETAKKMETCFLNSWYYQNHGKKEVLPFPRILYYHHEAWNEYLKAAICENLIKRGCTIQPPAQRASGPAGMDDAG